MTSPCPLCQTAPTLPLFTKGDILYRRCPACAFIFSKPDLNANFPDTLDSYEDSYLDYFSNGPGDEKNDMALKRWMEKLVDLSGKTILDVGTGSGKWVDFLRRQGSDATGLEPARELYSHFLKDKPGFYCQTTAEFIESHAETRFDVITSFDVLEHIEDPRSFLRDIHTLLKPGGYLFLSLPDAGSLLPRLIGKHWHHYNKYHMAFFSRPVLRTLCGELGFSEKMLARRGRLQSAGYIAQYFFDFVLRRKNARCPDFLNDIFIPVNFFDTMYLGFKKETESSYDHG